MQVFLALSGHPKANVRQVIISRTTVIGRSRDCGLQIASSSVSRKHCELRISDEVVSVVDLGSSNGTFVDSERLPAGEARPLRNGALLNVGGVQFLVTHSTPAVPEPRGEDVAPVAVAAPTNQPVASDGESILEDDVFVLDEPIALDDRPPAPAAVEAVAAEADEDHFVLDEEPDLSSMFADDPAPSQAAAPAASEAEPETASDEPILASDEDDAFAFLTEDDPAPVESRREDSRLGA